MSRTTKTIGFSVPPAVAKQVAIMAKAENRTRSELFREMVRVIAGTAGSATVMKPDGS